MAQFENLINPTTSYDTVEGNGTPVVPRLILNFSGIDFTVVDDAGNSRTNVILPAMVHIAGSTMTGNLILNGDPTLPLQAATKEYVDSLAAGLSPRTSCRVATTGALTVIYNNGAAGVGATLTNNGAQAALSIDSVSLSVNDRVLVKDQASQFQNGIYTVTDVGSGATNWVMTRATDYDQASPSEVSAGSYTVISAGTVNAAGLWVETGPGPFVIGTTAIIFSLFNSAANLSAAAPITLTGNVIGITTPLAATYGGTGVANSNTITLGGNISTAGNFTTSGANPLTFTTTGATNVTLPTTGTLVNTAVTTLSSLSTVNTITSGTWAATILSPIYGGTGINNGTATITLGASFSTTGANTLNFTTTGNTSLTLPTSGTLMVGSNNLSELTNTTTARANLGLGTAATHAATDFLLAANNLSDVVSVATSRTNLGLGTMATQNANAVAITGGTLSGVTITSPKIVTGLLDANGNMMVAFLPTIGSVNYLTISNGDAANGVDLIATGSDTNININLEAKGTGKIIAFCPTDSNVMALIPNSGTHQFPLYFDIPIITTGRTATFRDLDGTVAYTESSLQTTNNLSDLTNTATARANLGVDVGLYQVVRQVFTSSGTYTPTTGMVYCIMECWGAAAAGGSMAGSISFSGGSGGGGTGGYSRHLATSSDVGASKTVTIGAGGTAGAAGNHDGNPGGDTSIGSLCIAKGGKGGGGNPGNGGGSGGEGGDPGTGNIIAAPGQSGFTGNGSSLTQYALGGNGASSPIGGGGISEVTATSQVGSNGDGFNGAGSGGAVSGLATNVTGGLGTNGYALVTEYIKRG